MFCSSLKRLWSTGAPAAPMQREGWVSMGTVRWFISNGRVSGLRRCQGRHLTRDREKLSPKAQWGEGWLVMPRTFAPAVPCPAAEAGLILGPCRSPTRSHHHHPGHLSCTLLHCPSPCPPCAGFLCPSARPFLLWTPPCASNTRLGLLCLAESKLENEKPMASCWCDTRVLACTAEGSWGSFAMLW